ncbi:NAD(P)-binding protein [Exidia glandulosa HHB12029]|uniref:NAD(P)-binding protein n=1 Tax=Exidia glandulosa HHB12029 TaxID=1314781 RepID=A0A165KXE0_EXIGL|nr:NAD(P)-binding protein [Exidia glandulosa HHB12029]
MRRSLDPKSLPTTYTRVVLAERPVGDIIPHKTFRTEPEQKLADLEPGEKQVLVAVDYLSLDPAMRSWLGEKKTYMPPVKIGEIMRAEGLGTIVKTGKDSKWKVGQTVKGVFGWTEYAQMDDKAVALRTVPKGGELLDFLGPFGNVGMTAYFGLFDIGKPKPGETLVVTGAAGAVGSLVCQLGVLKGLKVYAVAGSDEKVQWLEKELGVTKAFNYKNKDIYDQLKKHMKTFDIYFDNVGGEMLNFMLTRMNLFARIVVCGGISDYNNPNPAGLKGHLNLISMRALMQGFLVLDYASKFGPAIAEMQQWLTEGKLKRKYHVVDGIKSAPEALPLLYNGGNTGKLVVRVSNIREGVKTKL